MLLQSGVGSSEPIIIEITDKMKKILIRGNKLYNLSSPVSPVFGKVVGFMCMPLSFSHTHMHTNATHRHGSPISECFITVLALRQISGFCQLTLDP